MPPDELANVSDAPGSASPANLRLDTLFEAVDAVNGAQFDGNGRDVVIVRNTGAGSNTFTLTAQADAFGRTVDTQLTLAAGQIEWLGPLLRQGWTNLSTGKVILTSDSSEIQVAVIRLPN